MTRIRESWKLAEAVVTSPNVQRTLLFGTPGTGKTRAAMSFGEPESVAKVTLHEEMPAATLEGHYIPSKSGAFKWHDGTAIKAWKNGSRLVLDEIDRASGDVLTFLYAVCDDPEVAALMLPNGKTVRPQPGFSVVATMNGHPSDLPEALLDRFQAVIEIKDPHPGIIEGLPEDLKTPALNTVTLADPLRRVSTRQWMAYAQLRDSIGTEFASQAVFGQRAEEILDSLSVASV